MNNHYTYFLILGLSLAGPLALSFDKKVAFYRKWKYLFPAMILPALFYIVWDMWFTSLGVWSFNPNYITGWTIGNLPVEEVLFFVVVPYCCVFIYECIRSYFPRIPENKNTRILLSVLAEILLVVGIYFYDRYYTFYTFVLLGTFLFVILLCKKYFSSFAIASFMVSYAVILIPFLLVNGFLTAIPVVLYNDAENLGVRIHTIPFEDAFYGMLLIMMIVAGYEKLMKRGKTQSIGEGKRQN